MIKIKFRLLGILFLCVGFNTVKAQSFQSMRNASPAQRAQYQTTLMKSKLKLDTMQIVKVQNINLKYAGKMQPILKSDVDKTTRLQQALVLLQAKDAEFKTVLSAVQYKEYAAIEAEIKSKLMSRL